jgi:phage protein, endolysin
MDFTFDIKGDPNWSAGTVYYYNGAVNEIQPVHNTEELKYLRSIYKDTTGRDLKDYHWDNNVPVYIRIFGALRPTTSDNNIKATLDKIIKQLENAT